MPPLRASVQGGGTPAHCTCVNVNHAAAVFEAETTTLDGGEPVTRIVRVHGQAQPEKASSSILVVPYEVTFPDGDGGVRTERRYEQKAIDGAGRVSCATIGNGVPKAHAIGAILSPDCAAKLAAIDARYVRDCQPFSANEPRGGGPGWLGVVATALGAAIYIRRRRER